MPWIFGSFLVTPCALTSCHIVISKQDSTIRADLVRVQRITVKQGTHSRSEVSLTSLQGGASVGTPRLLEEDKERRSPLSEYMSPLISHTPQKHQPFRE